MKKTVLTLVGNTFISSTQRTFSKIENRLGQVYKAPEE